MANYPCLTPLSTGNILNFTNMSSRKQEIREIAQQMFKEKGYPATSMRDLAKKLNIKAASLYNHIDKKEDILNDICFDIAGQFFQAIERVKKLELPPDELLTRAIIEHVKVITTNLDAAGVFLHEWRFLDKQKATFIKKRNEYEAEFHRLVEKGIQQQIFKKIDVPFYCRALFSSLNWLYDWYKPDGKLTSDEIAENLSQLWLNGIKQ